MARETTIESHLHRRMKAIGGKAKKTRSTGDSGWPDRDLLAPALKGKVILAETKTIGGYVSKIQAKTHRELRAMGYVVVVLWTREQVDTLVDSIIAGAFA